MWCAYRLRSRSTSHSRIVTGGATNIFFRHIHSTRQGCLSYLPAECGTKVQNGTGWKYTSHFYAPGTSLRILTCHRSQVRRIVPHLFFRMGSSATEMTKNHGDIDVSMPDNSDGWFSGFTTHFDPASPQIGQSEANITRNLFLNLKKSLPTCKLRRRPQFTAARMSQD